MALFGSNKKKEEKVDATAPAKVTRAKSAPKASAKAPKAVAAKSEGIRGDFSHVLKSPRITEKASMHQGTGVYTFDIEINATKTQIASAIRAVYKVTPVKIRVVTIPSKRTRSMKTGRSGVKSGGKKAYVYLKSGDSITIA